MMMLVVMLMAADFIIAYGQAGGVYADAQVEGAHGECVLRAHDDHDQTKTAKCDGIMQFVLLFISCSFEFMVCDACLDSVSLFVYGRWLSAHCWELRYLM